MGERIVCPVCNTSKGGAFVFYNMELVHVDCIKEEDDQ